MNRFQFSVGVLALSAYALVLSSCATHKVAERAFPQPGQAGSSKNAAVNAFFEVGKTDADIQLPADEVFPRGRLFPYSFYSTFGGNDTLKELDARGARETKAKFMENGLTIIGPQYELNDTCIEDAKFLGKKAIYTIEGRVDGVVMGGSKSFDKFSKNNPMPMDKLMASIAEQVKAVAANKEICWWNITPEELRPWRKYEVEYLKNAVATIKANDPLKRPVMMYEPGHRTAEPLSQMSCYTDFMAKGMYNNYSGNKDQRVWMRWSVEQELKAREMCNRPDITILALPEMFQNPKDPADRARIPSWVRHDVYCSLVAGAQGLLVFSARTRPNFECYPIYMEAFQRTVREITGKNGLGKVFLFGERRNDLEFHVTSGPETVKMVYGKIEAEYPSVSMANLAFDRLRYVVVVNSSNEAVKGIVGGLPYSSEIKVHDIWDEKSEDWVAPEGEFEVELPPLGAAAFVLYRD